MPLIRHRLVILLLLLGAGQGTFAQGKNQAAFIKRVTDTIAYIGVLKCEAVSRIGYTPRQYTRFDSLRSYCSSEELQALLKHKSPAVRGYAFWALSERPEVDLYPLLMKHRRDTGKYAQLCGSIGSIQNVIDAAFFDYSQTSRFTSDTLIIERKSGIAKLERADRRWFHRRTDENGT
ncbi:HEAT repeat domain-containing protein [Hymenobacter sp. UYP22]|uniref:HEAT repeat domain-containing protein n=1 Tax=Hymenobacter sp. UYP22 TaxID=3156348 RepID=UPI003390F55A